jgi:hypothetical protein
MKRLVLFVPLALAACSPTGKSSHDMATRGPDMTQLGPDLAPSCLITLGGDLSGSSPCRLFFCHPTSNDYEDVDFAQPIGDSTAPTGNVDVRPHFSLGRYMTGDFSSFLFAAQKGSLHYQAAPNLAGTTATVTFSALTVATGSDPCSGSAHGIGAATLVGVDPSTGLATGSGNVTFAIRF